jgi:hypothetical protein
MAVPPNAGSWSEHFESSSVHPDLQDRYYQFVSSNRAHIARHGDLMGAVSQVMDLLHTLRLDLVTLLYAISVPSALLAFNRNNAYVQERSALLLHPDLLLIVSSWRDSLADLSRRRKCDNPLERMALGFMKAIGDREMDALEGVTRLPAKDVSHEELLAIDFRADKAETRRVTPYLTELYEHVATTDRQRRENTRKNPESMVMYQLHCSMAHRSPLHGKFVKFVTMYMRSCHIPVKAYDTLNFFGITFSQKWMYENLGRVIEGNNDSAVRDFASFPSVAGHDNINKQTRAPEQRLDRHGSFDSGTAATVYIFKDPSVIAPRMDVWHLKRTQGRETMLTANEILDMEDEAGPRLRVYHIYQIMDVLANATGFDFESYAHADHALFERPKSWFQLPHGLAHRTLQYLLPTYHQECSSYDGTAKVLIYYINFLIGRSRESRQALALHRVLIWVGDQLTASRIRGVIRFNAGEFNSFHRLDFLQEGWGWLHSVMTVENSLHKQFYGGETTLGFQHAFIQLTRKYLHTTSTKGTFHHAMEESIHHIYYALVRTLWIEVADVPKLSDLQDRSPEQLAEIAARILDEHMSDRALMAHDRQSEELQDSVRRNTIMMARDLSDYILLVEAIQCGDVGSMKDLLPRLLFRFIGGGNKNYSREVAELLRCFKHEWPDDLM